jgi:hypothetical protein
MPARAHAGITKLGFTDILDLTAKLLRDGLHAVTDAENRHPEIEQRRGHFRLFAIERRLGTTRQDKSARAKAFDMRDLGVPRVDFAVNAGLAHAARDQLGILRPEIQDQEGLNKLRSHPQD